jgi:hypothetical protein
MSALSKTDRRAGVASVVTGLMLAVLPVQANAEILLQSSSGVWVNGTQFAYGTQTMPGIVLVPNIRGNSGFLAQRALAWSSYRRADSTTGLLLVDPAGNGSLAAATPRQANVRSHVARAAAYRLEYFKK